VIYNNLRYCIIESSDIDLVNFSKVKEDSPDTMRRSLDGTKTFVKYDGEQPEFIFHIAGNLVGLPEYTHEEFIEILKGSEWVTQD
tara:strand:+ start:179 stop:433 length:255 start_codon:yes stop_codon:yes gene_type:complete